jgi:hypothetical protein
MLADWPGVGEVLGVDPSPIVLARARELSEGIPNPLRCVFHADAVFNGLVK